MIKEKGLPPMTLAQQSVLVGIVSGALTGAGTIIATEFIAEPADRVALRRERYAALAATVVIGGTVGALFLALNAHEDGLRGNVG